MNVATLIAADLTRASVNQVLANDEVKKDLAKRSISTGFPVVQTKDGQLVT